MFVSYLSFCFPL